MKKLLTLALAFATLAATADLTYGQLAAAPLPPLDYRAGTAVFAKGQSGITVRFRNPMRRGCAVVLQRTGTAGPSPTSGCTYFSVLNKKLGGFAVQHRRCDTGALVPVDSNISLDYIAIAMQ